MTQNFCSVLIFIPSYYCKIQAFLKTSTDIRSLVFSGFRLFGVFLLVVLCCLFVCFSFEECVVFPSKCPAEKLSETSLCQLEAQLKTRIYTKLLPTETALRCLYCCVCRMSCWAATYYLDNTFLQHYASLQEAFGTSSEQYLGTRAKSHHCGPWGPLRQLCFQHRTQSGGTALNNN